MHCAVCGQMVTRETMCPHCGRPVKPPISPAEAAAVYDYQRSMRTLQRYWFLFACLNVALGVAGLVMVQIGFSHQPGPWEPWPHPPFIEWTHVGGLAWSLLILRVALSAGASLGLRDRTGWARPVAGLAAIVAMTQFPFGLALGAFTFVKITGKRNRGLFEKFTVRS